MIIDIINPNTTKQYPTERAKNLQRKIIHHYGDIALNTHITKCTIQAENNPLETIPFVVCTIHELQPPVGVGKHFNKENVTPQATVELYFSNTTSIDIYIKALEACKSKLLLHKLS